jgi:ATP-dependent Clp protease ATP-binding subunit ClpA
MFERFTRHARVAVVLAQEEVRELRTREIAPQHLLLGILQAAGNDLSAALSGYGLTADVVRARLIEAAPKAGESRPDLAEDAEALRAIGIDLAAVRDSVARTFGADAFDNALSRSGRRRGRQRRSSHIPFNRAAKKSLELAVREALAHKDNEIGCEHLLLGILRSGDKAAIGLITEHVYSGQLRASILALLDKAA